MSSQWNLSKLVDKKYANLPPSKLLQLPVHAIRGITERDSELLKESLGVETIGDLANNKFILLAQAIVTLAPLWKRTLDKEFEGKSPMELVNAPLHAFSGITPETQEKLEKALNIRSIGDLALNRLVLFAQAIKAMSILESFLEEKKD